MLCILTDHFVSFLTKLKIDHSIVGYLRDGTICIGAYQPLLIFF